MTAFTRERMRQRAKASKKCSNGFVNKSDPDLNQDNHTFRHSRRTPLQPAPIQYPQEPSETDLFTRRRRAAQALQPLQVATTNETTRHAAASPRPNPSSSPSTLSLHHAVYHPRVPRRPPRVSLRCRSLLPVATTESDVTAAGHPTHLPLAASPASTMLGAVGSHGWVGWDGGRVRWGRASSVSALTAPRP